MKQSYLQKKSTFKFTKHDIKFCLSLHCNGANSYVFVNGIEIYKFKAHDILDIHKYLMNRMTE